MNLLFGDSNIMRNVGQGSTVATKISIVRMTAKNAFDSKIPSIKKGAIVLANINMLVANEIREVAQLDARSELAKITAEDITLKLGLIAKLHGVSCAIVPPLPLIQPSYYSEIHHDILPTIIETIARRKLPIKILEEFPERDMKWCQDGTHLEEGSGKGYVQHILEKAKDIWMDDDEPEPEADLISRIVKLAREEPSSGEDVESDGKRLGRLERKVRGIQDYLEEKQKKDNEEFAHINERLDKVDNERMRSSLIVILPRDYPELKSDTKEERFEAQRKEVIMALLNKFDDGIDYEIKTVRHLNRGGKGRQVAEVAFDTPEQAGNIRKRFVEKVQVQDDLKEAIINLHQTPATKLRIDIMKMIAKRLMENLGEDSKAIVISHLPRPMLILEENTNNKRRAMAFVQAVRCFKQVLRPEDRKKVHERLRRVGYKGSAERAFMVLEDLGDEDEEPEPSTRPARQAGRGRGRGRGARSGRETFQTWAKKSGLTAKRSLEEDESDQTASKVSKK
jgi:hypothetical protein